MTRKNICFASLETGFWLTLNLFELWFWCFWAFLFQSYFGRKWSEKSHDTTISAIRKCIFWQGKEAESGSQSKFGGGLCSNSESERRPREKLFNKSSLAFVEVALALISSLPKTAFLKKSFNKMDILHFFAHPTQTPFSGFSGSKQAEFDWFYSSEIQLNFATTSARFARYHLRSLLKSWTQTDRLVGHFWKP